MHSGPNDDLRQVEHYGAYLCAKIDSDMEKDRQLLMLSSLAIGVLMGIFETDDLNGFSSMVFWLIASISFTLCIIATLVLFPKNSTYFKSIIDRSEKMEILEKSVERISAIASITFICGIISVFALVVLESKFVVTKNKLEAQKIEQAEEVQERANQDAARPIGQ